MSHIKTAPKLVPTFWAETYWRLNTASKPLTLFRLHTPISALAAGCSASTRVPYYAPAAATTVASEAHSEPSAESEASEASEHETCDYCGDNVSDCGGICGECGYHVCACDECPESSGRAQSDAMADKGSGPVSIVRGGNGWRIKWAGDPQPHRDRSFSSQERAEACKRAIETYMAEGEFLGAGRHRAGWLVGGLTVKVAMSDDGVQANKDEVEVSKSAPIPVPETAPLCDVSILAEFAPRLSREEARKILESDDNPFDGYWIDCDDFGPQLGRLPNGRVVCFDFSNN